MIVEVTAHADVARVQLMVRRLASRAGLDASAGWQMATAASEAATNMIKYARGGLVILRILRDPRPGLEFEAVDQGPGFADLTRARVDGVSEGKERRIADDLRKFRGLGLGLGAIERLTDESWYANRPGGGALVRGRKFVLHGRTTRL